MTQKPRPPVASPAPAQPAVQVPLPGGLILRAAPSLHPLRRDLDAVTQALLPAGELHLEFPHIVPAALPWPAEPFWLSGALWSAWYGDRPRAQALHGLEVLGVRATGQSQLQLRRRSGAEPTRTELPSSTGSSLTATLRDHGAPDATLTRCAQAETLALSARTPQDRAAFAAALMTLRDLDIPGHAELELSIEQQFLPPRRHGGHTAMDWSTLQTQLADMVRAQRSRALLGQVLRAAALRR